MHAREGGRWSRYSRERGGVQCAVATNTLRVVEVHRRAHLQSCFPAFVNRLLIFLLLLTGPVPAVVWSYFITFMYLLTQFSLMETFLWGPCEP